MTISRKITDVFVVAAKRTAFGTYGGKASHLTATDLAEAASRAALEAGKIKPETINSVVFGNVIQSAVDAIYLARHTALRIGVRTEVPALMVNRLCGSGFQAVVNAAQDIMLGDSEVVLCGGTENMSQCPYAARGIRFGTRLGVDLKLEDTLWAGLTDAQYKMPMGITAENLAQKLGITRQQCDEFALMSQSRWKEAQEGGRFKEEIVPIKVKGKKGPEMFEVDEHPRMTNMESLGKLPPVFIKDSGTVTAGNASGICDGAGALVLANEAACKKHGYTPLARLLAYGISGCDPKIMGIGPVPASKAALQAAGLKLEDMDLVEVNEAFAPQFLSVAKELGLDMDKTNVNGGAIALGHPVGASGARITGHLVHEIRRRGGKYALGSACIGGGQGITIIMERV